MKGKAPSTTRKAILITLTCITAAVALIATNLTVQRPSTAANRHADERSQPFNGQAGTPETEPTPVPFNAGQTKLHTTDLSPEQGRETMVTLITENSADNPPVTVTINAQVPNGMQVTQATGENWIDPACKAQCVAEISLSTGESNANNTITVIAGEPGSYTVTAESWWRTEGNPAPKQESAAQLTITVSEVPNSERADPVSLHADITEAEEGTPISVKLSMINSIGNLPMTAQAILDIPPGMTVRFSDEADSCVARCNANHTLQPGENKHVQVTVNTTEPGDFVLKGYLEWYYGDDKRNSGQARQELSLKILPKPVPQMPGEAPVVPPTHPATEGNRWNLSSTIAGIVIVGLVLLALFGRNKQVQSRRRRGR